MFDWPEYVKLLKDRFDEDDDDPMAELKKLQETDGIVECHQKFENIKMRVNLFEDYLVCVYLAGLRLDTQMHVKMFQPRIVRDCLRLGRLYEKAHPKKTFSTNWQSKAGVTTGVSKTSRDVDQKGENYGNKVSFKPQNTKKLTQQEMSDRRAKGLCYFCDEKFTPEHYLVHKKTQLFSIDVDDEYKDAEEVLYNEEEPQISVNAVSGVAGYRTMRVRGTYGKKPVFILIDSGSTHNFIDSAVAAKLGCAIEYAGLTRVSVADGRKINVDGKISKFTWNLQTTTFQSDILLIPLQGIDMVLGVQWLETLGRISWEFKELEMKFKYNNQKVLLRGIREGSVRDVKAQKLRKLDDDQVQIALLYVREVPAEEELLEQGLSCSVNAVAKTEGDDTEIEELVKDFPDIFAEPTELPPFRTQHDHKIELLEGSNPVNQRPYRYSIHQKNEIDKLVEEMLQSGTVQVSSSPYASPVVLVKKKDGSWRLCVDYRELNGMTVKDRFPIPLIEDLMDELGGSVVFSKIDLREGYHQVRLKNNSRRQ